MGQRLHSKYVPCSSWKFILEPRHAAFQFYLKWYYVNFWNCGKDCFHQRAGSLPPPVLMHPSWVGVVVTLTNQQSGTLATYMLTHIIRLAPLCSQTHNIFDVSVIQRAWQFSVLFSFQHPFVLQLGYLLLKCSVLRF